MTFLSICSALHSRLAVDMSGNKASFPGAKKLAFGIMLTIGANVLFLAISFTVREYPVNGGELILSKGIIQVRDFLCKSILSPVGKCCNVLV